MITPTQYLVMIILLTQAHPSPLALTGWPTCFHSLVNAENSHSYRQTEVKAMSTCIAFLEGLLSYFLCFVACLSLYVLGIDPFPSHKLASLDMLISGCCFSFSVLVLHLP